MSQYEESVKWNFDREFGLVGSPSKRSNPAADQNNFLFFDSTLLQSNSDFPPRRTSEARPRKPLQESGVESGLKSKFVQLKAEIDNFEPSGDTLGNQQYFNHVNIEEDPHHPESSEIIEADHICNKALINFLTKTEGKRSYRAETSKISRLKVRDFDEHVIHNEKQQEKKQISRPNDSHYFQTNYEVKRDRPFVNPYYGFYQLSVPQHGINGSEIGNSLMKLKMLNIELERRNKSIMTADNRIWKLHPPNQAPATNISSPNTKMKLEGRRNIPLVKAGLQSNSETMNYQTPFVNILEDSNSNANAKRNLSRKALKKIKALSRISKSSNPSRCLLTATAKKFMPSQGMDLVPRSGRLNQTAKKSNSISQLKYYLGGDAGQRAYCSTTKQRTSSKDSQIKGTSKFSMKRIRGSADLSLKQKLKKSSIEKNIARLRNAIVLTKNQTKIAKSRVGYSSRYNSSTAESSTVKPKANKIVTDLLKLVKKYAKKDPQVMKLLNR